jgi:uncharacterized protein (TIGR02646 family)
MTPLQFIPPNFWVRLRRPGQPPWERLENGASEEEVRRRLEKEGYEVLSVDDYDFGEWQRKASAETTKAIQAHDDGSKYEFSDSIWRDLKDYLFRLFKQKCAYCEGGRGGQTPGAVEHYRPKSTYYWLAYDYRNYLPACPECNTKKGSGFPLLDETRRARHHKQSIDEEKPALISPYEGDTVWNEFSWDILWDDNSWSAKFITARPASRRAEATIEIVGLNRDRLQEDRAVEHNNAFRDYQVSGALRPHPVILELKGGLRRYSAACLAAIRQIVQRQIQELE